MDGCMLIDYDVGKPRGDALRDEKRIDPAENKVLA
jgi:hypothetical protein